MHVEVWVPFIFLFVFLSANFVVMGIIVAFAGFLGMVIGECFVQLVKISDSSLGGWVLW